MNIGIVTTWFERGAAYVSKQYKEVLENEHNVFIYARGGEYLAIGNPDWDSPFVTWGRKLPLGVPMSIDLSDFKKWILKNKLDIILFNEQQWWPPVLLANRLGVKTVAYVDYYTRETVPLFANYDFLICNTKRHMDVFNWHKGVKYVPWGTNLSLFKPKSYKLVEDGIVTFFHSCGVSPERKGTDLLIKSFVKIKNFAKLVIHSQIDIKKNYPELSKVINELVKSERLLILEKTITAPGLYYLGDVYVYPSRLEGIGLTIAEALSCGLPVVTSDNPPMNEFVSNDTGKLVKIDHFFERTDGYYWKQCEVDIDDLVEKMKFYIENYDDLIVFKKKSREYAEEYLDWNKNKSKIINTFNEIKKQSIYDQEKNCKIVWDYEKKRGGWRVKLYMLFPWLFYPFVLSWVFIKKYYIKK